MADATERAEANIDESKLTVGRPKKRAVGAPAVLHSMEMALDEMGPARAAKTLLKVNQVTGFDCMGCAWPDPAHRRHTAEFCENGAKAVAEEATTRRVPPAFFAAHPLAELESWDDFALGKQGRMVSSAGGHNVLANSDVAVVLFNETRSNATIGTTAAAVGEAAATSYGLANLWSGTKSTTSGTISASVPAHGVVMYRLSSK